MLKACLLSVAIVLCLRMPSAAQADEPKPAASKAAPAGGEKLSDDEAQAAREAALAKLLTGATLVGSFTETSDKGTSAPKEEKYTLTKVAKLQGDTWLFQTRIQYGGHDATLPLPLPVKWAGDTPMIYLDKFPVPGFGTFSARVIFHEGKYSGTWNGEGHGGHLFGRIVPGAAETAPTKNK